MTLFKDYASLWKKQEKSFISAKVSYKKVTVPVTEREYVRSLGSWRATKKTIPRFNPNVIPYIELSKLQDPGSTILFVGMNPSGADVSWYYKNNGKGDKVKVYKNMSPYYLAMENFARECLGSLDENKYYSELDVFGIVQGTQAIIEKHFLGNPQLYLDMFRLFLRTIVELNPKLIIVTNAFVRRLLMRGNDPKDVLKNKKYDNFYFNGSIRRYILERDNLYGGYKLVIGDKEFYLYFSCMLSGQRAIDLGNREILIWLVRNYLIKKHGMKL